MTRPVYLMALAAALAGPVSGVAAQAVPPAPPPLAGRDTTTTSYVVGGLRVIQRRATANDVVAANLYLLGGTRQLSAASQGVEALLFELSERGTRKYRKDVLRRRMARLGSAIVAEPGTDWTIYGLRATTGGLDSTWAIFADRLMAPTLDSAEFELVRAQYLSGVRQRSDNPDALLSQIADSLVYAGHPYSLEPIGTVESISRTRVSDLRRYLATQMVTSRMLLVVVGNVDRAHVERLVRATIGKLPPGAYRWTLPPPPQPIPVTTLTTVQRQLPTNYILGYYQGPPASSPDYQALRVAAAALSGRLYGEIRTRQNLTYAVEAPFVERALATGGLYVTTVSPDTTLKLMHQEVADLQNDLLPQGGLERLIQQFITEYFLDNETNAAQADFLARAQLFRGDYRTSERFVDELRSVTPEDVRRVTRQYMKNLRFAYVGDPERISPAVVSAF